MTKSKSALRDPYGGLDPREIPAYNTFEGARYLRIPERTLFNWTFGSTFTSHGERRKSPPLIEVADPLRHLLSFVNLLELHVLDALRRVHHVKMPRIRQTIQYLRREFQSNRPLIYKEMWTDGASIFVLHYGDLINASEEGQLAMEQLLEAHLKRIERDARGLAVRLFPLTRKRPPVERISDEPRIIAIDPRVAFGRPVIAGSQIPTVEVAERFKAGESVADLADDFRRPQEEIEEAVRIELDLEAA